MPVIEINYDLHAPEKSYDDVIEAIKGHPGWCHVLRSCWLVAGSNLTVSNVYETVRAAMDQDDHVFVHEFRKPYRGWLPKRVHEWIDQHV